MSTTSPSDLESPPVTNDSAVHTLQALAAAYGVATEYGDWHGQQVDVCERTISAVLTALGVDVSSDVAARAALAEVEMAPWRRVLPPTVVARGGWTPWVHVHVPVGVAARIWLELEDGGRREVTWVDRVVDPRAVDGVLTQELTVELPGDLPTGWHTVHAETDAGVWASATLIVAPHRLDLAPALAKDPIWGVMTQVYQARSEGSWGIGDLADLAEVSGWSAGLGADFVLINPLHAAEPSGPMEPSPYLPTSRRFTNPIYLRVEDIPEYAYLAADLRRQVEDLGRQARELNHADTIDRDQVWAAKRAALQVIYSAGRSPGRTAAFDRFVAQSGPGLRTYAIWCALTEELGGNASQWPRRFADPNSSAVSAFAAGKASEIRFHEWLQWHMAQQQARTQQTCRDAGMSVGVVTDLAVGVHPHGADAWGLADVLASGVSVGAPPDQFNQLGQNWHQPPWHPTHLAEAGYAPFRDMVRAALASAGGLRIDHVIGLFRLWWIPSGLTPADGTYVRYDYEALVGILVLEAQRAGAVLIGEDLGVVEPLARDVLAERGILGTSVVWFEWSGASMPTPPENYRALCLATVTTHDLPPSAGYLELAHVRLRRELGLLTRSVAEEEATEREAITSMAAALIRRGLLVKGAPSDQMVLGLHRYLAMTPARMRGVALSDLVGDRRIINQPGTATEYPNWRLPLADAAGTLVSVEALEDSPTVAPIVAAVTGRG